MNTNVQQETLPRRRRQQRLPGCRAWPFIASCLATLLALPVNAAVVFPPNPLQTGAAYPPPNVMFILDDSGSMAWDFMPGPNNSHQVPQTAPVQIQLQTYARNTAYYNPNVTYRPWIMADGTRYTGGMSYNSVYSSNSLASGSTTNLSNSTRTFYVPQDTATNLADSTQYDRYSIRNEGVGGLRVVKTSTTGSGHWDDVDVTFGSWQHQTISVPAGTTQLYVYANDDRDDGDLYVRFNNAPTTGSYNCRDTSGTDKWCTINNPASGTWYISVYATNSGSRNIDNIDVSYAYGADLGYGTPPIPGRSEADEIANYAVWYSYHRTRSKMAKAGASEAFAQVGENLRVGFDTIWNRTPTDTDSVPGTTPAFPIPVGTDDGLFKNTNRTTWFDRLQNATANDGTPLKGALQRAGQYYEDGTSAGPWGPESGSDQLSCRQSVAILTTDGYWNSNAGYVSPVGDADASDGAVYTSAVDGTTTGQYLAVPPYSDKNGNASSGTYADTLADVANEYWKRDLQTTLDDNVPSSTADPAFWQHMATFSLSIGEAGSLDPDTDLVSITNGSKYWPNPLDVEDNERIDDLWHAAVNGHGNFTAATEPSKFAQALVDALSTIAARNGSASNVTSNGSSLQSDSAIYQAKYVSGSWTGELESYAISGAGVASSPTWQASPQLTDESGRNILTWDGVAGAAFPTIAQTTALARAAGIAPVTGPDNADYLKGGHAQERRNGGLLRDRATTVLGDIVNSSPYLLKEGSVSTLFVGANDGMLHAFDAGTGAEKFAYIPAGVNLANLASLSDPKYAHRWFVDGPVVVSSQARTPGVNYLIGSLGRGGNGLFGLDVTNPATFSNANVKWDMTGSAAPADMGQVLSEPLISKLNDGSTAVIASNGINSSTGTAALFIINPANGSVIRELDTAVTGGNGLSAPRAWDNDGNGTVDYVYAGDLQGNLWKFDLTAVTSAGWAIANAGAPMFVATDASDNRQPITAGLSLAKDPATGKRWVFFGTGSFMTTADITDFSVQSMYGVIDEGSVVTARTSGGDGDLDKHEIILISGNNRGFEPNAPLDPSKKGWYIDLLTPPSPGTAEGERIVNRPIMDGTVLITVSMIPPTDETCNSGGRGYLNALDAFTGTSTSSAYLDTDDDGDFSDETITSGGTTVPIGSVDLGVGIPTMPTQVGDRLYLGGSNTTLADPHVNSQAAGARRISWREILRD